MTENKYHIPVLLKESVDNMIVDPDGVYVDVTFGGGGHSRYVLSCLGSGRLIGFDQDEDAEQNLIEDERFTFVRQNFGYLKNYLRMLPGVLPVDGVLADLGVSSHQFDTAERGFSFRFDVELDMRMNRDVMKTAKDVLMGYEESELRYVFKVYGELSNAYKIAKRVVGAREEREIGTIGELKELMAGLYLPHKEHTFFAKLFQALRIEVNDEMKVLERLLEQSVEVIKKGGRFSVITYHSLEDRMVKRFFKSGNVEGKQEKDFYGNLIRPFKEVNRKPIVPSDEEVIVNNRARSAKLRVAERI
ncbi:MAG: 16S rRNA (cytosine(1402)-N(4))-methyltransferase RsmH [Flavobacteriales bacterium]|jgi:16S rRNA (cytosine1402-N4)-methyltransferase|nr:16S rRNA (cytosine(1402)-N(4))-methyltransferase RsmH [Flavobacteriales bacterium]